MGIRTKTHDHIDQGAGQRPLLHQKRSALHSGQATQYVSTDTEMDIKFSATELPGAHLSQQRGDS